MFGACVCCGQTDKWIKMPIGTEVCSAQATLCYMGDPAPPKMGHSPHLSAYVCCGQTAAWIKVSRGKKVVLGPRHIVLNGDSAPLPQKVNSPPPIFGPCLLWPSQLLLNTCCTAHRRVSRYFTMRRDISPQNCLSRRGIWSPSNSWYLRPTPVIIPNGISIGSAVFVWIEILCCTMYCQCGRKPAFPLGFCHLAGGRLIHGHRQHRRKNW